MNVDNGNVYFGKEFFAAIQRGEPVIELKGEAEEMIRAQYEQQERRQSTGNGRTAEFLEKLKKARV